MIFLFFVERALVKLQQRVKCIHIYNETKKKCVQQLGFFRSLAKFKE